MTEERTAWLGVVRWEPDWGYQLRRGLIQISVGDFAMIERAMTGGGVP